MGKKSPGGDFLNGERMITAGECSSGGGWRFPHAHDLRRKS